MGATWRMASMANLQDYAAELCGDAPAWRVEFFNLFCVFAGCRGYFLPLAGTTSNLQRGIDRRGSGDNCKRRTLRPVSVERIRFQRHLQDREA